MWGSSASAELSFCAESSEVFASDQDEAVVVVAKIGVDGLSLL